MCSEWGSPTWRHSSLDESSNAVGQHGRRLQSLHPGWCFKSCDWFLGLVDLHNTQGRATPEGGLGTQGGCLQGGKSRRVILAGSREKHGKQQWAEGEERKSCFLNGVYQVCIFSVVCGVM